MMIRLFNTLSRSVEDFQPINGQTIAIYSCGPTVYNTAHIGNMSSYIVADTLRRMIQASNFKTKHVMNYTDIDDKTIRRSQELHGSDDPKKSLVTLTRSVEDQFQADLRAVGVDVADIKFVRATESIEDMLTIIRELHQAGIAYIADDGVYFSIKAYQDAGKRYGQLSEITAKSTGAARVNNDEYDKDNVHDFALWKIKRDGEPYWEFELDGHDLNGRPGWHIECSAMSRASLGQPFDIHTGGIDLVFPHHENEIAQSTGAHSSDVFANYFVHSEHLLVDGKKMAKSLGNVYLIQDIVQQKLNPLAFRLLVLQSHYRHQMNFSWTNLAAAENRLKNIQAMADLRFQPMPDAPRQAAAMKDTRSQILEALQDDLNTPEALTHLSKIVDTLSTVGISILDLEALNDFVGFLDKVLGLELLASQDISKTQAAAIQARQQARDNKDFAAADVARDQLLQAGIELNDTPQGTIWRRA